MRKSLIIILLGFLVTQFLLSGDMESQSPGIRFSSVKLKLKEKNNSAWKLSSSNSKLSRIYNPILSKPENYNTLPPQVKKKTYKVDPVKAAVLGAVGIGVFAAMHVYYQNTWWQDQVTYFKFAEDGYYARNMDKASHLYTANFFTEATAVAYEWAGVNPKSALLYGALTSIAYETYIEINDGFAPNWGFDWVDMGANIAGALYPFLQRAVPTFENVNFKWSFQPGWIKKKAENSDDLLDDYTNMTFWLSVNPMIALPKSFTNGKLYPKFLALALGMSVKNASHENGSQNAYAEWIISLDWDITKFPGDSDFWRKFKKLLNFYHFPAPAVKISPNTVWYGLYF